MLQNSMLQLKGNEEVQAAINEETRQKATLGYWDNTLYFSVSACDGGNLW